jgi:PAB-dependent poly(A)-specific ribonuclease subunit 2
LLAGALGLLEEDPHNTSLNIMLQGLTRFLLDRFAQDYKPLSPNPTAMEQVNLTWQTQSQPLGGR